MSSIEEITETGSMQRMLNKELMVAYINANLISRSHLDVRKSFVYYDESKTFVFAMGIELGGPGAESAFEKLGIKYWSKGIV
jgi:hypothetical protein